MLTGRAVRIRAPRAMARPVPSETRCAASASSANDPNTIPPATSTTRRAPLSPSAQPRARGLRGRRGQQLADLGSLRHAARDEDLLVDDEGRGGHDPVSHDRGVVLDLLDGRVQAEGVDGLAGDAFEVLAVGAAGA